MKDTTIYVLGHKNPDTDSICSAIAYSELKAQLGYNKVIPGRLGSINPETKYILDYFNVPVPMLVNHVRTQMSDIDYYDLLPVYPDISVGAAWKIMMDTSRRMLPIVDKETKKLLGAITLGDISRVNMKIESTSSITKYKPLVKNVASTLNAAVISGKMSEHEDKFISNDIIIAMSAREMRNFIPKENDMVITRSTERCTRAALETNAKYIFLIGESIEYRNVDLSDVDKNRLVLVTNYDIYSTVKLLNQSISVSSIMTTEGLQYFYESDFLKDARKTMLESRFRSFPIVSEDDKVLGLVTRRHAIDKNKKKVIIVDHNEFTQAVTGLDEAELLEIIDHHRVGDVQTLGPILFRNEPLGSTCTIIAKLYEEKGIKPSAKMAGIMLSGIISDTLLFKSPTCTEIDIKIANELAKIANIDIDKYGIEILMAGAALSGKTIKEIINTDFKEYKIANMKLFLSQIFTADLAEAHKLKNEIAVFLDDLCQNNDYDFGALVITDILGSGSEFIFAGKQKEIAQRAFRIEKDKDMIFLPNVVSRKKQIVPILSEYV